MSGYGYSEVNCKDVDQETCYNAPELLEEVQPVTNTVPEPEQVTIIYTIYNIYTIKNIYNIYHLSNLQYIIHGLSRLFTIYRISTHEIST